MSKAALEIIDLVYSEPENWEPMKRKHFSGELQINHIRHKTKNVEISQLGNTSLLSISRVLAKGESLPISASVRRKAEKAGCWWLRQAPLSAFIGDSDES